MRHIRKTVNLEPSSFQTFKDIIIIYYIIIILLSYYYYIIIILLSYYYHIIIILYRVLKKIETFDFFNEKSCSHILYVEFFISKKSFLGPKTIK